MSAEAAELLALPSLGDGEGAGGREEGGRELTRWPWWAAVPSAGGVDGGVAATAGRHAAWRWQAGSGMEAAHAVKLLWCACVVWGHGWREQRLRQEEESLPSAVI